MNEIKANELHPIAAEAAALFLRGNRSFTREGIAKLEAELEKIRDRPELGPALASLVQVAQYLERGEKAKDASLALLKVVLSQTSALEALNQKAKLSQEDEQRKKREAFAKFSGG